VDIIETLVRFGAKLKAVADEKNIETPLHIAARTGRQDIVEKLIEHGASVMARTKDGSTPLHYAAAFGQSHVIEPLVKVISSHFRSQYTPYLSDWLFRERQGQCKEHSSPFSRRLRVFVRSSDPGRPRRGRQCPRHVRVHSAAEHSPRDLLGLGPRSI